MNFHRYVMWRYHVWLRRQREALLDEARREADDASEQSPTKSHS
jgi:hypothetical protein